MEIQFRYTIVVKMVIVVKFIVLNVSVGATKRFLIRKRRTHLFLMAKGSSLLGKIPSEVFLYNNIKLDFDFILIPNILPVSITLSYDITVVMLDQ